MTEDARIGVFTCSCGDEISSLLDIDELEKKIKSLPDVVFVQRLAHPCSKDGLRMIVKAIKKENLDRLVVAGCSYRIYALLFRSAFQEAGMEGYPFEMANIKDLCCSVHPERKKKVTAKAERIVRMAVAKLARSEPCGKVKVKIEPSVLVVGGGMSGMTAALTLANQDISVILIDKEKELGGLLRGVHKLYPSFSEASGLIKTKISEVKENSKIELLLECKLIRFNGRPGQYQVAIEGECGNKNLVVGAIVAATGAEVFEPAGLFGFGEKENVITQMGLEKLLSQDSVGDQKHVVMIQCVGARNECRAYCSRTCCMTAVKNSILLKQADPDLGVSILFRDLQTFGRLLERGILKASKMGVNFYRYQPQNEPEVKENTVTVSDELSGKKVDIPFDLLVLSTPLVPRDETRQQASMMNMTVDRDGFIPEAHLRLRPRRTVPSAIYPCGCAHWPATVPESMFQAYVAASKAAQFLQRKSIVADWAVPNIVEARCRDCSWCEEACPFGAISMKKTEAGGRAAYLDPVMCKTCGICVVTCPCGAIVPTEYTPEQVEAMVGASVE